MYNPHPLLDIAGSKKLFRYNGKAIDCLPSNLSVLFKDMEESFRSVSTVCSLDAGDMIVVDQNRILHGRMALAERNQNQKFSSNEDRLLFQTYLRNVV